MKDFMKRLAYTLTIILVFVYGIYTIIEQQIELDDINKEEEKYANLLEKEEMRYEQNVETIENIDSDEYIEEIAREKLGYVMPYEIIFADGTY